MGGTKYNFRRHNWYIKRGQTDNYDNSVVMVFEWYVNGSRKVASTVSRNRKYLWTN